MIKVAITDDHPLVRAGFTSVLQTHPGIEVIDTYANGNTLLEGLKIRQPDVLLLDLNLSGNGPEGVDLIRLVKEHYPDIRILVLTSNDNLYNIQMMLNAGAEGYLLKNVEQQLLVKAIEKVYANEDFLSPEVKDILLISIKKGSHKLSGKAALTEREIAILRLIAEEYTSQEISAKLHLSYRTVETYRLAIMQKLGVKNMVGMTKKAILLGIIK